MHYEIQCIARYNAHGIIHTMHTKFMCIPIPIPTCWWNLSKDFFYLIKESLYSNKELAEAIKELADSVKESLYSIKEGWAIGIEAF